MTVFAWGALTLRDGQLWIRRQLLQNHDDTYDAQVGDYILAKRGGRPAEVFEIASWRGDLAWLIKVDWLSSERLEMLRKLAA